MKTDAGPSLRTDRTATTGAPTGAPTGVAALRIVALTALAYAGVGWLALSLAAPPSYASALYPSAGIALAAAIVWGAPALGGTLLGAFLVNVVLSASRGQIDAAAFVLPATIAVGATLQAALGRLLVRRWIGPAPLLADAREIAVFGLAGAPLACIVSAGVATGALLVAGAIAPAQTLPTWGTWWIGDTLGVLIGAPITLTLFGHPAAAWRPRRRTVALPMVATTALLALATVAVGRWDEERTRAAFALDADRVAGEIATRLRAPLHALQALASAAQASGRLDEASLRAASRWWLAQPYPLQAMGYSERVAKSALGEYEAAARRDGLADYRVYDRDAALAARDADAVPVRGIEPRRGNSLALGVNTLSVPAARAAVERSRDSGEPAASQRFALAQSPGGRHGMVVYQALYDTAEGRDPGDVAARQRLFRGVVFVTMRVDELLAGAGSAQAEALQWCLVEIDRPDERVPLAGEACVAPPGGTLASRRRLDFAGRTFELGVVAVPEARVLMPPNAWLLSVAGMCSAALLGALLLTMSGHALRVEQAVDERTALLQREVLERQQAERARREGEERLRSILDHAAIGVMFFDQDGRVVEANPHLAELLGRPVDELQRSAVSDFLDPDEVAVCRERLAELQAGHADEARAQVRMRRADGETVWVLMRVSALRGTAEEPQRFVGLVEDHSDRMRLEQAERERERAEAANRAKSDFVSRMSHELRTPLNAMLGFAQILALDREPGLAPQQREWVMQIQRAGWHLLEMINETLDLARIEAGAVRLALGRVDVAPMLAACAALVDASARQRSVTVTIAAGPGIGVIADETRLKQVLTNLLSNAIKYNREGGAVTVSTSCDEAGHVAIAVADSGLGMTPEQMSALFQPYNRLGREHTAIEGTGIGLVISRRLAELMNGTLEVSSRAGRGSTFTLRLAAAAAEGAAEPASPARAEHARDYHRRIVHYIEDNETNVELMRGVLAQRPQVELAVSTNGLDGLAALRLQRPDLILLDMHLPDISGLELLRHLKRDDDVADIPVIVVSADATTARMQEALTLGALHYVTKPLEIARFLHAVDEVLQSQETRWGI